MERSGDAAPRRALVVMAREPVAGAVKTRLAAALGDRGALDVYVRLLADTLARAGRVAGVEAIVALRGDEAAAAVGPVAAGESPTDAGAFLARVAAAAGESLAGGGRWRLLPQREGGLGERLAGVFADLFAAGFDHVAIVDSDSPALPEEYLRQGFALLDDDDDGGAARLVLGPTADGGFYLVGTDAGTWCRHGDGLGDLLRAAPMGTSSAFDFTRRGAHARGLEVRSLPVWVDVDEVSDLPLLERLLPAGHAAAAPRGEPLAGLREVYLHVTNRCLLDCPCCYNRDNPRVAGEMATGEWRDAIDQCVALGAASFVFIGGDPFLRDDLIALVDHVTGVRGRKARIFFNGLINAETADELARVGRGRLRPLVSVDGTCAVNDELRAAGNFDDTVTSIRHLVAAGLAPVANTVLLAPVLPVLADLARELRAEGVDTLHLILPHARGGALAHPELVPSAAAMAAALDDLVQTATQIGLTVDNLAAWRRRLAAPQDFCASGCRDLAIDPFGRVHACTITCGDPAFVAGDLREQDLETIWRTSPALRLLRHAHARDRAECAACPVVDACGGECWMQAHYAARATARAAGYTAPFPYCDLVRPVLEGLVAEAAAAVTPAGAGGTAADGGQAAAGEAGYALFDCI